MATVTPTITRHGSHTVSFSYALTQANAVGHPIPERFADYADRSVQLIGSVGNFDSGTVVLEGSNDGTNYATLTDPQGNAISKTAAGIEQVTEQVLFARPSSSGGGASHAVTVVVVCRRSRGGKEV